MKELGVGRKAEEVIEGWKKLHIEDPRGCYSVMKS